MPVKIVAQATWLADTEDIQAAIDGIEGLVVADASGLYNMSLQSAVTTNAFYVDAQGRRLCINCDRPTAGDTARSCDDCIVAASIATVKALQMEHRTDHGD